MHSTWTRKTRAWGYDVIRGIDADDPLRVIRAFKHPTELAFVDLNTQVEGDYGGYVWTEWMHVHFGDTALHIALKWKRHRAVKALLSLRPNWTVPNEAGTTAEELVLQVYDGKDITTLKDEQEREYENDAMRSEEKAMKSLVAAELDARERARLRLLQEIHASRTRGIGQEAATLLEFGRVLAREDGDDSRRAALPRGVAASRWVSHVCRELRRNRFAAQRGAMRRNVVPSCGPPSAVSSLSPPPPTPLTGRNNRTRRARAGTVWSDTSDAEQDEAGPLSDGSGASAGGGGSRAQGSLYVRSPPRQRLRSPARGARASERGNGVSRPTSPGGLSAGGGSMWSAKSAASPTRFDRSSRMSNVRKTRILAAGKSMKRETPMERLQRKMASKTSARRTRSAIIAAPPTVIGGSPPPVAPSPLVISAPIDAPAPLMPDIVMRNLSNVSRGSAIEEPLIPVIVVERNSSAFRSVVDEVGAAPGGASMAHGGGKGTTTARSTATTIVDAPASGTAGITTTAAADTTAATAAAASREEEEEERRRASTTVADGERKPPPANEATPSPSLACRDQKPQTDQCPPMTELATAEQTLREVGQGPMKKVLATLLGSTVIAAGGERVLAASFPCISALLQLKYCGPVGPTEALALGRVLAARPGVLLHLNLAGKRIGDEGATQLAPALASIRTVDLRSSNIGDAGATAIASEIRRSAVRRSEIFQSEFRRSTALMRAAASHREEPPPVGTPSRFVEKLSLAGNRIGDAGAVALIEMLLIEEGGGEERGALEDGSGESGGRRATGLALNLRWLSVAGNPCISELAKARLCRAGTVAGMGDGVDSLRQYPRRNGQPTAIIV